MINAGPHIALRVIDPHVAFGSSDGEVEHGQRIETGTIPDAS